LHENGRKGNEQQKNVGSLECQNQNLWENFKNDKSNKFLWTIFRSSTPQIKYLFFLTIIKNKLFISNQFKKKLI